jgi:hypothetical protein
MISAISTTGKYILQFTLLNKHQKTVEWLSSAVLWKWELAFFQKLLDRYATRFSIKDEKKQIDHFQSIITYYKSDLIDSLTTRLRSHEKNLAEMLLSLDETKMQYFKEHDELVNALESLRTQLNNYKTDLYAFIEKGMANNT